MTQEAGGRPWGLVAAPLAGAALFLLAADLPPEARKLAFVLGVTVTLWITEVVPLPVGALIGVTLAVALGIAPLAVALASFSHPLIFLFLGSFLIAEAMQVHGLDRRVGAFISSHGGLAARPWLALCVVAAATAFLSAWLSNTATTAMVYPLALGMLPAELRGEGGRTPARGGYPAALMLAVAFASTIGGLATPVGTPPNLIGLGQLAKHGYPVRFGQWTLMGAVVSVVLLAAMLLILRLCIRGPAPRLVARTDGAHKAPLTGGEKATLICFLAAVVLWIGPSVATIAIGAEHPLAKSLTDHLPEGLVGLGCGVALFILPSRLSPYAPALRWEHAARIDWGTLLLFGGGMSLGEMFFKTGLADALGKGAADLTQVESVAGLTLLVCALAAAVSEATSNTATATMAVPVAIALAGALKLDPTIPALGAAMASSLGSMLPVSTAPNAIVYGTGHVRLRDMAITGLFLDAAGVLVIWAVVVTLGPWILGR